MSKRAPVDLIVRSFQDGKVLGLVSSHEQGGWTWRASPTAAGTTGCFFVLSGSAVADRSLSLGRALAGLLH